MFLAQLQDDVSRIGFHIFDCSEDAPLESLAIRLGNPVASVSGRLTVDTLVPKAREDSKSGTLSFSHGTAAFPFHTETAHWRDPVDLVILKCVDPGAGNRPTLLIDGWDLGLGKDDVRQLTQGLMVVKNGFKSFLAPSVTCESERLSFRHDPTCMKPASKPDKTVWNILEQALVDANLIKIAWKTGQCLVLDNRRMLHSRGESSVVDYDRQLERIYIGKKWS